MTTDYNALYDKAKQEYGRKNYEEAETLFLEVYQNTEDRSENLYYYLASCYYSTQKSQSAHTHLEVCLGKYEGSDKIWKLYLDVSVSERKISEAIEKIDNFLKSHQDRLILKLELAKLKNLNGDYNGSLVDLKGLLSKSEELTPEQIQECLITQAHSYYHLQDNNNASVYIIEYLVGHDLLEPRNVFFHIPDPEFVDYCNQVKQRVLVGEEQNFTQDELKL